MTDGALDVAIFPRKGRLELLGWMARIWHTGRPGKPPRVLRGKVIDRAMRIAADPAWEILHPG